MCDGQQPNGATRHQAEEKRQHVPVTPLEIDAVVRARAELQDGLVTTADLAQMTLSRPDIDAMLRAGAVRRVCHGVFALPVAPSGAESAEARFRELVRAVVLVRARGARRIVPAGPASVAIHGLPLFGRPPALVHVAAPHHGGRKTRGLVRPLGAHRPEDLAVLGGLTVAAPARAILDTARVMSTTAGVVAADAALRLGIVSASELADALATLAGHLGVVRARKALELANRQSESPGESWSAVVLDHLGLPPPQRQARFEDADGFIGRTDFWWPRSRTVGEFDGRVKYGRTNPSGRPPEEVLWDEKRREDRLRGVDLRVVRWTADDLRAPIALGRRLTSALLR